MTVAAANGGVLSWDTQLTGDYTLRVCKGYRLPDGGMVAGSGSSWPHCYTYIQWLIHQQGEAPSLEGGSLLIVRPDYSHWLAEEGGIYPLIGTINAIGCGAQAALLGMNSGMSPAEAVASVCRLDAYCSEPIQTMRLLKRKK